ncbi:hypothetical protein [Streptomyces lunaelactis]|nr:hypothetical protein [Streptomyces lunaelactis]NUK22765.1 hypothetical protein [Streptomyces lunaelactis]NUK85027.1 hypothetical protein [Streptomyces lunaelactis]
MNEAEIRRRIATGEVVDLQTAADKGTISAVDVRAFCTGQIPGQQPDAPVHLRNALITEELDLRGRNIGRQVIFSACEFNKAVNLTRLRTTQAIVFDNTAFLALLGEELISTSDLVIRDCRVAEAISLGRSRIGGSLQLTGSTLHDVDLESSQIGGDLNCAATEITAHDLVCLNGRHLHVSGEIIFRGSIFNRGEVNLQWAHAESLRATSATLVNSGGCALRADGLHVAGDIFLDEGFKATGAVTLVGARLGDELRCTDATFDNRTPPTEANLRGRALDVERIEANDIYLDRGFKAHGEVRLVGAQLETQLNCTGGKFHSELADYALNADDLAVRGDVFLNGTFLADGEVRLVGASIGRELNCTGGRFIRPSGIALNADGMTTEGSVFLNEDIIDNDISGKTRQRFVAMGQVRLARATVGRQLDCVRGFFCTRKSPEEPALDLAGMVGKGDTLLTRAAVIGGVSLSGASIDRNLNCQDAFLSCNTPGTAFQAVGMRVGGTFTWKPLRCVGLVDLGFAYATSLDDNRGSWPGLPEDQKRRQERKQAKKKVREEKKRLKASAGKRWRWNVRARAWKEARGAVVRESMGGKYDLTGFTYVNLTEEPCKKRVDWLKWTAHFSPLPWQQLASHYRKIGQEEDARRVIISSHKDSRMRGELAGPARAWNFFIGAMTGYGYKLYRPFIWVLGLWGVGILVFYFAQDMGIMHATRTSPDKGHPYIADNCTTDYPCYIFWLYPLALLMPVLNLWLVSYWLPSLGVGWGWLYLVISLVYITLGWILGVALVAGVRHLLKTD